MRIKKNPYLTLDDAVFDSRIPLRSEEEFRVGITFDAKLVGCGSVPRPSTRMEIVAAMRRIRADCRSRKDKKRKVVITVSYEGVRVALPSSKKSKQAPTIPIAQHPIHRIFYVSHDSLDLHIFSYIAREGSTFRCMVFKAAKQALAVNVVRTIGQAFELCHKMTLVMNEATTTASTSSSSNTVTNHVTEQNQLYLPNGTVPQTAGTETSIERKDLTKSASVTLPLSLGMEKTLHSVEAKLDQLVGKVELLEQQLTNLLNKLEIRQVDDISGGESDSQKCSLPELSTTAKKTIVLHCLEQATRPPAEKTDKLVFLNSPDSLLSSPILNTNTAGSCLLFNHLF